jgi:hypothetical protein
MIIDKITIKNNCEDSVYFGQSMPRNAEIKAGDEYHGDWQVGGPNVGGRLAFSYESDLFTKKVSGDATNNVWIEIAGNVLPGKSFNHGSLNFANQVGFMDLDLEVTALGASDDLICADAKARTALDPNECHHFTDESGEFETIKGRPFCSFTYGRDNVGCATSEHGKRACTSSYASYISDHSMLWKPDGQSATSGHWLAQARSTGRSSGEANFPAKAAKYQDGYVAQPTLNGRVGCGENTNGAKAVNFECFESCCMPSVVGLPLAGRKEQCEAVGGVTAGTQGFITCEETKGVIHIKNLEIVTCPARADLSSGNVKMPSCPTGAQQNPATWSQSSQATLANTPVPSPPQSHDNSSTTISTSTPIGSEATTNDNSSTSTSTRTPIGSEATTNDNSSTTTSTRTPIGSKATTNDNSSTVTSTRTPIGSEATANDNSSTATWTRTPIMPEATAKDSDSISATSAEQPNGSSSNRDSNGYDLHI